MNSILHLCSTKKKKMEEIKNYLKNPLQLTAVSQSKLDLIKRKVKTLLSIAPILIGFVLLVSFVVFVGLNYQIYFSEVFASSAIISCFLLLRTLEILNN